MISLLLSTHSYYIHALSPYMYTYYMYYIFINIYKIKYTEIFNNRIERIIENKNY